MVISNFYKGAICCILGAVTWGINGVVSQFLLTHYVVDPAWVATVRMLGAGLILIVPVICKYKQTCCELLHDPVSVRHLLSLSLFGLLLCQYAYLTAIKYTNSGTATVMQTLSIVMMSLFLAVRFRRRPSWREQISVVLAIAGVFLVATNGNPSTMVLSPRGLTWCLIDAVSCVTYPMLSQGLAVQWGALIVNALGMIVGGTVLCLGTQTWTLMPTLDGTGWLAVAFIVIVGTALSFTFFVQGIRLVGPMKSTLIGTLEPITASTVSAYFLGTAFHPAEWIGFVCILATVFIIVAKRPSR